MSFALIAKHRIYNIIFFIVVGILLIFLKKLVLNILLVTCTMFKSYLLSKDWDASFSWFRSHKTSSVQHIHLVLESNCLPSKNRPDERANFFTFDVALRTQDWRFLFSMNSLEVISVPFMDKKKMFALWTKIDLFMALSNISIVEEVFQFFDWIVMVDWLNKIMGEFALRLLFCTLSRRTSLAI